MPDETTKNPDQLSSVTGLSQDEIKDLWKLIDRKMKRVDTDTEISGPPNYLMADPDNVPLMLDTGDYNAIGNLSSKKISELLDQTEKNKFLRINRYRGLEKAMENPEIEGILNIYADEATTEDMDGEVVHVLIPNKKAQECVEAMFARTGVLDKSWDIIRNFCGFGDEFYEVVPSQSINQIHQIIWIPREKIERVEVNGVLKGFKVIDAENLDATYDLKVQQHVYWQNKNEEELIYPFRILHFRMPSSKYSPYGKAVIDTVVSSIEQLNMLTKAMLIARVTRAPERRVYHVDVGNLQGEKAIKYANEAISYLKRKRMINLMGSDNKLDVAKDVFGATEDIVLPKRTGADGSTIDTLEQIGTINIDDAEFIRDRIFPAVGIPRQYLFDDQFANANTNLSSKSVPFAKKIRRVQRYFLQQLYKLAIIELKLQKFSNEDIENLTLLMNNPSNIDEKEQLEIDGAKWQLIQSIKQNNTEGVFYPDYYLYKNYLKLNDDEIVELLKLSQLQQSGQNIFNFMKPEDRPEGAEALSKSAQPVPEGEPEAQPAGGVPMGAEAMPAPAGEAPEEEIPVEAGAAAPEAGGVTIPPEVEAALGTPPLPETAEYLGPKAPATYTEQMLLMKAIQKKQDFLKKLKKQPEYLLQTSISEDESPYTGLKNKPSITYIETYGELDGLEEFFKKKDYLG